jgi:uncharacterized protein (DUF885 family)
MRMLMKVWMPVEPFNTLVRNGTAGAKMQQILEDIKPEAAYFTAQDGHRGGIIVVNVNDTSEIPRYAEPFFLTFDAEVQFHPAMTPQDLGHADLAAIGKKWA